MRAKIKYWFSKYMIYENILTALMYLSQIAAIVNLLFGDWEGTFHNVVIVTLCELELDIRHIKNDIKQVIK